MKIIYNQNPLKSVVELDENDKKLFWHKIKIEELVELISTADFYLEDGDFFDLNAARSELSFSRVFAIDEEVNKMMECYIEALQGEHIGDCTCFAAGCVKCHAEGLLGITTIPNMSKHVGHWINHAFQENETLHEAIEFLRPLNQEAYEWLVEYHNNHFSK